MNMNRTQPIQSPITEENSDGNSSEFEATPEDFEICKTCQGGLTEDEKIINARFVNEAIQAERDISIFPVCIACNFEKLEKTQGEAKYRE